MARFPYDRCNDAIVAIVCDHIMQTSQTSFSVSDTYYGEFSFFPSPWELHKRSIIQIKGNILRRSRNLKVKACHGVLFTFQIRVSASSLCDPQVGLLLFRQERQASMGQPEMVTKLAINDD